MENKVLKFGQILLEQGFIDHDQLLDALEIQKRDKRKLGDILVDRGILTDQQIAKTLAGVYHLPYVDLFEVHINENLFSLVSWEILKKLKVLPIELKGQTLSVATNNPLDVTGLQEIRYLTGYHIKPVMASSKDIEDFLDKHTETMNSLQLIHSIHESTMDVTPILNLVESLINKAIKERASDIHLEPMEHKMRVRFRVDGVLYEKNPIAKEIERKVISRIKILSGLDVADSRRPQDGRMSMPSKFKDYDIRISTLPDIMGENVVMRILERSFTNSSFESLGMDALDIPSMTELIKRPYGIILVCGPTGAGKTTTLYSMLNMLNQTTKNIITVEDPVEYKIEGINQTAINNLAGYTFTSAIRHILRHDPNIIMVGEIRDPETAETAIRAALTGHLVISTLHTNSSVGAIMRLLDMKIEPFLIRSAVIGAIAQRLVRRLCGHCRKEYEITDEIKKRIPELANVKKEATLASPAGCDKCYQTGYAGRVAIFERLIINDSIRNLVLQSPSEQDITTLAISQGMRTLRMAGIQKALEKYTSLEEVLSITIAQ